MLKPWLWPGVAFHRSDIGNVWFQKLRPSAYSAASSPVCSATYPVPGRRGSRSNPKPGKKDAFRAGLSARTAAHGPAPAGGACDPSGLSCARA
eukprot:6077874-Prymnesium_polylepis.2